MKGRIVTERSGGYVLGMVVWLNMLGRNGSIAMSKPTRVFLARLVPTEIISLTMKFIISTVIFSIDNAVLSPLRYPSSRTEYEG